MIRNALKINPVTLFVNNSIFLRKRKAYDDQ